MARFVLAILAAVGVGVMNQCEAQTIAERLGHAPDAKLLIVHGDDIGMCHAHNTAAIQALEKGIVTSGSIMVPCPWFMEIARYAQTNPNADLGLHLTLTSEWKNYRWRPLAALDKVKGLFDAEGYMHRGVMSVYESASAQEVEAELRAQIEFAIDHGIQPTHLDSHMGTLYYNPGYFEVFINVAEAYDIPFMFFSPGSDTLKQSANPQADDIAKALQARGVPLLDDLKMIDNVPVEKSDDYYRDVIQTLKPGVTEIIIHMSEDTDEMRNISGSWRQRAADLRFFTDPATKTLIDDEGVILIGWRELAPLWQSRKK